MEEASRLDLQVFWEVIIPLLGVKDRVLLGISTPLDQLNYYSQMVNAKDDQGKPFFNVVQLDLSCTKCKEAGDINCKHRAHLRPPWKTQERHDRTLKLMESQPELQKREVMGSIVDSQNAVFSAQDVSSMLDRPDEVGEHFYPEHVFTAVDPTGGGGSDFAMITMYMDKFNHWVVRGAPLIRLLSLCCVARFPSRAGGAWGVLWGWETVRAETSTKASCTPPDGRSNRRTWRRRPGAGSLRSG